MVLRLVLEEHHILERDGFECSKWKNNYLGSLGFEPSTGGLNHGSTGSQPSPSPKSLMENVQ